MAGVWGLPRRRDVEVLVERCSLPFHPHQRETLFQEFNFFLWFPWGRVLGRWYKGRGKGDVQVAGSYRGIPEQGILGSES